LKENIENKVNEIINTPFDVTDINTVPDIDDARLTFANTGLRFNAITLYIDMRGSTEILNKHHRTSVAKLHKAYFHIIVKIVKSLDGEVRSFNGDGMLVFFQGTTKGTLSNAVISAMKIKYMLAKNSTIVKTLEKYSAINFGIGIDYGKVLCSKVGVSGTNNRDLVWIGNTVNKSVKIGDKLTSPNHIGISSFLYDNLLDEVKYGTSTDIFGKQSTQNMWTKNQFTYNGQDETYYSTHFYWKME